MWCSIVKEEEFTELPPATRKLFVQFVNCANRRVLHPLDWRRFYAFVRFCHSRRVRLYDSELKHLLIRAEFPPLVADRLALVYEHGRKLLSTR